MLRSRDYDFIRIPIADLEYPRTSALLEDGPGLSMEPPVGHTLLDARVAYDMDLFPDIELLDNRCYR